MKLLFLASEVAPFSKTGGLADVMAALPAALASIGHEVLMVTPLYAGVDDARLSPPVSHLTLRFPFGLVTGSVRLLEQAPNHRVAFIEQPGFFGRPGIYQEGGFDHWDNHRRFAFFSMAALTAAEQLGFKPDILHLNDWQTGLAALAHRRAFARTPVGQARSVFTIHNLAYQGNFDKSVMRELGLPWSLFTLDYLEFYDRISFLKAGLAFSDVLTTVSPRYAEEITSPAGGQGLDGFLRTRRSMLHGILNGISADEWNPAMDPRLPAPFEVGRMEGKRACKEELARRFGLVPRPGVPLFGVVSRLAEQKGIDLLISALPQLLERELDLVILGKGDTLFEEALRQLSERFPGRFGLKLGFDQELSHLVEGGSDFFLMPSRFEPCGLNQLYSLRYGAVPVVRATGGLDDTVVDLAEPGATGIKFTEYLPHALLSAVDRALALYGTPALLQEVQERGMRQDFSWDTSARAYDALYRTLVRT